MMQRLDPMEPLTYLNSEPAKRIFKPEYGASDNNLFAKQSAVVLFASPGNAYSRGEITILKCPFLNSRMDRWKGDCC